MKRIFFLLFYFSVFLFACNSPKTNSSDSKIDSTTLVVDDPEMDGWEKHDSVTCEDLQNKKIVWDFAREHVLLSPYATTIDTSQILIISGHFIDNKSIQTVVWIADYPMPSCGNGCNLVMLFSCDKEAKIIFSTTTGVISKDNVRDLDNDGVLEIISESSICRMGECHEHYDILNFADTMKNVLYEGYSFSYLDEGWGDNYEGYFDKGETLQVAISPKLIDPDENGIFKVKQVREVKTFNGGKTIAGITKQMIIRTDSSIVPLKKIEVK